MIGRQPEYDELALALAEGRTAVLSGGLGSGRSSLLRALATADAVELVAGRESVDDTPFLALLPLLAAHDLGGSDPLAVLAHLPGRLLAKGTRLVVDDAELLDAPSAVLVAQLARSGVPMVLSSASPSHVTGPLRDVVMVAPWVSLGPLSRADIEQIASDTAGQPLDPASTAAIWRRSAGNPGVAVALTSASLRARTARPTPAGLHLGAMPADAEALAALGVRAEGLGAHRATVQRLAVGGRLPSHLFEAADLATGAADGLLLDDGRAVTLVNPLIADWALGDLSAERRRALAADSAEALAGREDWAEHRDLLDTLARGSGDAARVRSTARWLLENERPREAWELIDAGAWREQGSCEDALVAADAFMALGRTDDALAALDLACERTGSEHVLEIVERLAALLGGRTGDDEAFELRVARLTPRLDDARVSTQLEGAVARRRVIRGEGGRASEDPVARLLRESLTGSLADARSIVDQAPHPGVTDEGSLEEQLRILIHFLGLVYDGHIVEAREIAERQFAAAQREARPVLGLWSYNRAKIALHAGQFRLSAELGDAMVRHLRWRDPFGLLATGEALYASALARCGRIEEAETLVAGFGVDELHLPRARLGAARVRAQRLIADGDVEAAAGTLEEAGRFALEHDEAHSGLLGLDEASWLSPSRTRTATLEGLRDRSRLATAFADRATARDAGDVEGLADAAQRLEAMIQPGRAADIWAEAARLLRDRGEDDHARRAHRATMRLRLHWRCQSWPPDPDVVELTARELDVARRAAARQRSREIAEALGVSPRTVDNHLARAFRKLGVGTRSELADVLGVADPDPV